MGNYRNPLVDHDALAAYLNGFEAVPTNVKSEAQKQLEDLRKKYGLDNAKKQAEDYVKRQAADILQKSGAAAAEKFLKEQGRAIIKDAGQKLGVDAAKAYGKEFMKGMKLPGMPAGLDFQLPSKLTVDEIEKAAYNTGKNFAENTIQSKLGVRIELPKKLTIKEISRTVDSLIPDDAAEALNMTASIGLQVAAGAAASALTTLATATAIGSAIPGLGSVIGLGVGLAAIALKGTVIAAFTQTACDRNKAMCKCKTPPGWRKPDPGKRSPVDMLPWLAQEQTNLRKISRTPALCTLGEVPETENWFATLSQLVIPFVGNTIPVMGLPSLERLLPAYIKAASLSRFNTGHQGDAASLIKYGWTAGTNSLGFVTPGVASPLATIQTRVAFLRKLVADANAGNLDRWSLATELKNAITQYTLNPSSDNERWFVQLGTLFGKLEAAETQKTESAAKRQKAGEQRAAVRFQDSPQISAAVREQLSFLCDGGAGDRSACQKKTLLDAGKMSMQDQIAFLRRVYGRNIPAPITEALRKAEASAETTPPVKRQEQKLDKLKKEIADLQRKADAARRARDIALRAVQNKDAQRQQAVAAGLNPSQAAAATAPLQQQTAAAVSQAVSAAALVKTQQAQVQQAAAAAQVPMQAVQRVMSMQAPARPAAPFQPFWQSSFTSSPLRPQTGAAAPVEPAQPAIPSGRPDLFSFFFRR